MPTTGPVLRSLQAVTAYTPTLSDAPNSRVWNLQAEPIHSCRHFVQCLLWGQYGGSCPVAPFRSASSAAYSVALRLHSMRVASFASLQSAHSSHRPISKCSPRMVSLHPKGCSHTTVFYFSPSPIEQAMTTARATPSALSDFLFHGRNYLKFPISICSAMSMGRTLSFAPSRVSRSPCLLLAPSRLISHYW